MIKEALAALREQEKQKAANDIAYQVKHAQDRIDLLLKEVDVLRGTVDEGLLLDLDDKDAVQKYLSHLLSTNIATTGRLFVGTTGRAVL